MALFNQAPSRTITYLKRKRWIAINREIKSFSQTSNQSIFPLPADNSAPPRSPVSCFDISPSQVNDSSADLEITKQPSHSHIQPPPVPAILNTALSAISSLNTESGWYLCHSSRDSRSNSINYNYDVRQPTVGIFSWMLSCLRRWRSLIYLLLAAELVHLFTFHSDFIINICSDCSGHHWQAETERLNIGDGVTSVVLWSILWHSHCDCDSKPSRHVSTSPRL